jgi:hypothetical protein
MKDDSVGKKISKLKDEGESDDQSIATALNMKRKGRLGKRGGYKRGKRTGGKRN